MRIQQGGLVAEEELLPPKCNKTKVANRFSKDCQPFCKKKNKKKQTNKQNKTKQNQTKKTKA